MLLIGGSKDRVVPGAIVHDEKKKYNNITVR
jgi:hypothetical protein